MITTSVVYKGKKAVPGTHYDMDATPSYVKGDVTIHLDVIPLVDDLIVQTLYFRARYKDGKWIHEKGNANSLFGEEEQQSRLEASIIGNGNAMRRLDNIQNLYHFLNVNEFHATILFIDKRTMSQGMVVTMEPGKKDLFDEITTKHGWHVRSRCSSTGEDGSSIILGVWITRMERSARDATANSKDSLIDLLETCGFEHSYQEPRDFSVFPPRREGWEVRVLATLKEIAWIKEHVNVPGTTITMEPIDILLGTPQLVFHAIIKWEEERIEPFPSDQAIHEFMREFKHLDDKKIDARVKNKKTGSLLGIADETSLYLEIANISNDLASRLDAFCKKWGASWKSEQIYGEILITIRDREERAR